MATFWALARCCQAYLGDLSTPDEPNIMQWLKEGGRN